MEIEGRPRLKRVSAFLLVVAAIVFGPTTLAAGPKVVLDIPAGNALATLPEFYLQSKVQVLYLTESVRDVNTKAVSGELSAAEALGKMLEGTQLVFEFEGEFTAFIRNKNEAGPQQADAAAQTVIADPASP